MAVLIAAAVSLVASRASGAPTYEKDVTISPAPAPSPALGHRLLPLESELNPGDAAPIYLRLTSEGVTDKLRNLDEKSAAWLALPLDQFPKDEARKLVDEWGPELLQLEYGARRESCHWNYTLPEEREHVMDLRLSDSQRMRGWARLLALKARVEIAEHQHEKAARTIETGLAFSRHVGIKPFLINALNGMASAFFMLDRAVELVAQPDAPNLYWSLTALPRPLISAREATAHEYKLCEWLLPEMTDLDRPSTEAEWSARLSRFHGRLLKIKATYHIEKVDPKLDKLADFREWVLPQAREFAKARKGKAEGLSDDRMILLYFGGQYRIVYDDVYKAFYLPFPEAEAVYAEGHKRLYAVKYGPLWPFVSLIANVEAGHRAEAMLDRGVAALRVVEALRLHAAAEGRLPQSLDEVKVVPIPIDPVSGKPFEYRLDGDTATLSGVKPKGPLGLTYRITLRKSPEK